MQLDVGVGGPAVALLGASALFLAVEDGSAPGRFLRALVVLGVVGVLLALLRARRGHAALVGATLVVAGSVAGAVGVGIGLPHLAKEGVSAGAVAGLALLAGGLAVLAQGLVLAAGPRRQWWSRALVVIGAVGVLAVALYVVGQAVAATNVPSTRVRGGTPASRGLERSEVHATTADGVRLSGWYVPSRNGAAVLLLHGAGSTRSNVLDHAEVLARHGYGALLLDARGHGRSGGRAMDFGWYGDEDVSAGIDLLARRPDVEAGSIAVLGLSMGGEEAIGAAGSDERIAAVVAEGVGQRVADDTAWLADEYGWRGAVQVQLERLVFGMTDLLTDADPPPPLRESIEAAAPRPVLLIAGGAVHDEPLVAARLQAASPGSVRRWTVRGAGHTAALDVAPEQWERRVVGFLDEVLGVRTAG